MRGLLEENQSSSQARSIPHAIETFKLSCGASSTYTVFFAAHAVALNCATNKLFYDCDLASQPVPWPIHCYVLRSIRIVASFTTFLHSL